MRALLLPLTSSSTTIPGSPSSTPHLLCAEPRIVVCCFPKHCLDKLTFDALEDAVQLYVAVWSRNEGRLATLASPRINDVFFALTPPPS